MIGPLNDSRKPNVVRLSLELNDSQIDGSYR